MVKKILFMSDFFRSYAFHMRISSWLLEIFKYQLKEVTDIYPVVFGKDAISYNIAKNFHSMGFEFNADWTSIYHYSAKQFPELFIRNFTEYVTPDSLVIGFDFPDCLINLLNEFGITYITLMHHPVRFLSDVMLGFKSNSENIFKNLKAFETNKDIYYITASKFIASCAENNKDKLKENSLLLCGQTEVDRSLLSNGKILAFNDFENELSGLFKNFDTIYFKKHPYNQSSHKFIKTMRKQYNIIDVSNCYAYELLANPNITTVAAISSGMVYESQFFGKKTVYLFKYPFKISHDYPEDKDTFIPILGDFLNPWFWKKILTGTIEIQNNVSDIHINYENFLRESLNQNWGYLTYQERQTMIDKKTFLYIQNNKIRKILFSLKEKVKNTLVFR